MTREWLALAVMALALLTTSTPVPAKPGKPPEVYVVRGGKVEITLAKDAHRYFNPLICKIIKQPRYGELSDLVQQSNGTNAPPSWQVTYTHRNDPDSLQDTFTYECRNPITGQRGRGRVNIIILEST